MLAASTWKKVLVVRPHPGQALSAANLVRLLAGSAEAMSGALPIHTLVPQLEEFRERIKHSPGEVQIEHKAGYSGGGEFGAVFAAALGLLALGRWRSGRRVG